MYNFDLNQIQAITTDSRQVRPGSIFIAIEGDQFDGHQFISQAIQSGATHIIAESKKITPQIKATIPTYATLMLVESTVEAIRNIAKQHRDQFQIPIIAIVGAVGKTTTKELLASLLRGKYQSVMQTEGSQNGFLGIPLTLLKLKPETDIAVIEVGIDDIGAMEQHMNIVQPTHVLMTAIGPEHLHQLKTVEIAAQEELKAFDFALKNQKKLAINGSDPWVKKWFDQNQKSLHPEQYIPYTSQSSNHGLESPLPGAHHHHNLVAALTMCQFFKLTDEQLKKGLSTFKTAFGRTELHQLKMGAQVIADYYNSNPTSAEAALQLLSERAAAGNRIAILGDMLELGENEETYHRNLAPVMMRTNIDRIILFGPRMKWLQDELQKNHHKAALHFEQHDQLANHLRTIITPKDTLLIKGSRGMKMETILKLLEV